MKKILYVLVVSFVVTNTVFAFGDDKDKYGKEVTIE